MGEQPLYELEAQLAASGGISDLKKTKIGIRSLEIVKEKDKHGKSFYVKLNGVPVFMKGANYIPQDNLQDRVTKERYEYIINSAVEANMNMLRVWGGGIYEEDIFYELCDEKGLLVWQEIMYACGMFPADEDYLTNVRQEVIDNVTRLRNHPSVALYCGNNENEISWYSWGWKEMYDEQTQKQYEKDLKKLFYKTIPEAIEVADPDRYYHPSSPMAGFLDRPMGAGDTHYWGVWHGKEPFANFEKNVSRFISEYGFQSYPEFASVKKFSIEEDWFLESDVMYAHQRCMSDERRDLDYGNRLINTYLERNFKTPKDFEHYLYVVQALQAKGIRMAVETHRRNRTDNYCMGTLYWQINDCWPAASWSSIDYYGKWKALHYLIGKAYEQVMITHKPEENRFSVYVVSDELKPVKNAKLYMQLLDFKGNVLWQHEKSVNISENTSDKYFSEDLSEIFGTNKKEDVYFRSILKVGEEQIAENIFLYKNEKHLNLPHPNIQYDVVDKDDGYKIKLNSDSFAKYVMITLDGEEFKLSDNYFDLHANEAKLVKLSTSADFATVKDKLKVISLTDSFD